MARAQQMSGMRWCLCGEISNCYVGFSSFPNNFATSRHVSGAYKCGMIELSQIAAYLRLKYEIVLAIAQPDSDFLPSRREMSEGLARSMTIAGESWTYATAKGGYSFTSPRRRLSVFVADDPARHSMFTSPELLGYLRAFTALAELNQLVIDMWLTRAAIRGEVLEAKGGWRLAR